MDHTAGPILEIGVLLLAAALAGWLARRVGLPAVVGYLGLGIVVSPFTPGYVANRDRRRPRRRPPRAARQQPVADRTGRGRARRVPRPRDRRCPAAADRPSSGPQRARPVPDRVGLERPGARRARVVRVRGAARPRR